MHALWIKAPQWRRWSKIKYRTKAGLFTDFCKSTNYFLSTFFFLNFFESHPSIALHRKADTPPALRPAPPFHRHTRFTTIRLQSGFHRTFDYSSDQTHICFTDSCLLCVEELNLLYNIQLQYRLSRSPAEHSGGHPVHALYWRMHSIG